MSITPENVVSLPQSDADFARDLANDARVAAGVIAELHQKAAARGMRIEYQLGPNAFGQWMVHGLTVTKQLVAS